MKQLILNADDFGMTHGVNEGIMRAHREGILTSTTLMANGLAFADAVKKAAENPKLGVGCHLVLVGGKPVAPAGEVPSLVDSKGNLPDSLPEFVARVTAGMIKTMRSNGNCARRSRKSSNAGAIVTQSCRSAQTYACAS